MDHVRLRRQEPSSDSGSGVLPSQAHPWNFIARGPVSRVLSTPFPGMGDHSSRGRIAPSLQQPTRAVSVETDLAVKLRAAPIRSCSRWGLPCRLPLPEARCALTAPFQFRLAEAVATCFLLHCPLDHSSRPLAGTVISWSPDFPRRGSYPPRRGRPALWRQRLYRLLPWQSSPAYSSPRGLGSSRASRMARHSPSMIPSISSGRKRR